MKGTITIEHLADHQGLAALLMGALKPGYQFDELLVPVNLPIPFFHQLLLFI
ncbi:rRNA biogenesis protein rrp5 [Castilleja foliolosa]|uniref:rRNA biogenesis protein rrp5 n=1 Tax=Castilleja foliolosa TaxID=1961234 RepID=A0ABD3ELR9_9LAMI